MCSTTEASNFQEERKEWVMLRPQLESAALAGVPSCYVNFCCQFHSGPAPSRSLGLLCTTAGEDLSVHALRRQLQNSALCQGSVPQQLAELRIPGNLHCR